MVDRGGVLGRHGDENGGIVWWTRAVLTVMVI